MFFPKYCLECRKTGKYICNNCLQKVEYAKQICPVCKQYSYQGGTHELCLAPTTLDRLITVWKYDGVVRKAILALKYRFASAIADELAEHVIKNIERWNVKPGNYSLVPIPLYKRRENWRGFNQSAEIGKRVAVRLNWIYHDSLLIRTQNTIPQVHLSRKERMQNIIGKYAVNSEVAEKNKGKTVILLDDVWTTGSTIAEAAKIAKKAGILDVWGMAIART